MKPILLIATIAVLFTACKTSKDYLSRGDEDKTLFDIVKTLNKHSTDENATAALPVVYKQVRENHLRKIAAYESYREISRWDKILGEYNILQDMFIAITNSGSASRLVTPVNYQNNIYDVRQQAADDYYTQATGLLQSNRRDDIKLSYKYFNKSDVLVPGYKDAKAQMEEAYRNAIINVVINPVVDNSFFYNAGWGNTGYSYSNEYFQQNLVRELGGIYATRYPAKFYTDLEARGENIQPEWVVDLTLRNMDIPRPSMEITTRNVSRQIENNKDSTGKSIYQTVYATITVKRSYFVARAQMDVNIVDVNTRKTISFNSYSNSYNWEESHATFTGDRRALSNDDLVLINNTRYNEPRKEEVLSELYRQIYPQVKNRISYAVDW
ncbi:MAG: hypothetical protein JST86_00605 [Bacteroidetes bacterium]|nr:hypothetical protein [Bacteroidota bacterium]